MELLTLRVSTGSAKGIDWLDLRRLAMQALPVVAGLRARSWRASRRALLGRYLFENMESLQFFRSRMVRLDSAIEQLLAGGQVSESVHSLPSQLIETVFDRPVFIISAPRAGSTLLYETLSRCEHIYSIDAEIQNIIDGIPALHLAARDYRSQVLDETDADPDTASTLRACLIAELQDSKGHYFLDHASSNIKPIRIIEKTPENALRIPFLRKIFPDAKFVYLYRDLRQNVSSIVEAWQHSNFIAIPDLPGWLRKHWSLLLPENWRHYNSASLTEVAAFQWGAANRAIIHELEGIPKDQWTTISYENLIAAPVVEISRLCEFIDVNPGPHLAKVLEQPLPLSATTISPPSPIKWKSNKEFDPLLVKGLQPLAGRMRSLRVNTAPPVCRSAHPTNMRFSCFVDRLKPLATPGEVLVVPSLKRQLGSSVPITLLQKTRHRERFLQDYPMLWVEDGDKGIWCPLWLRHHQSWLCSMLRPGCPAPPELTGKLRDQLYAAGVLATTEALVQRRNHGYRLVVEGKAALQRNRYCVLPQFLDPVLTSSVSHYYNKLISSGEWPLGDAQVKRRHGWHNERVAQFLHNQLIDIMSKIAGRPLKPTYSFASAYRGGAELDAHMDREQCDYTLSLLIDESPRGVAPWPLWFQAPDGQHKVNLSIADAVFFRGCELPHWRGASAADHEQINLLFHFVPSEWAGVMD